MTTRKARLYAVLCHYWKKVVKKWLPGKTRLYAVLHHFFLQGSHKFENQIIYRRKKFFSLSFPLKTKKIFFSCNSIGCDYLTTFTILCLFSRQYAILWVVIEWLLFDYLDYLKNFTKSRKKNKKFLPQKFFLLRVAQKFPKNLWFFCKFWINQKKRLTSLPIVFSV